jgi:bacillithiol system protein YtxJ
MGLFSKSSAPISSFPWKEITSVEEFNEMLNAPTDKAKLFFKHSTRCSISSMALKGFEREWNVSSDDFELYFVDLIAHRDISNAIAAESHVEHQSPQVVVWRNGEVIYNASHHHIDAQKIQQS